MTQINLSPTTLGIFKSCPKCSGCILTKSTNGREGFFHRCQPAWTPLSKDTLTNTAVLCRRRFTVKFVVLGKEDLEKLNKWRYWKTSLTYQKDNVTVYGAFDDLLRDGQTFLPLDYKTRASTPNEETLNFYLLKGLTIAIDYTNLPKTTANLPTQAGLPAVGLRRRRWQAGLNWWT